MEIKIRTEIFQIPVEEKSNIIYLPFRGMAFYSDSSSSELVKLLREEADVPQDFLNSELYKALDTLGLFAGEFDIRPNISPVYEYKPTDLTLLFTNTCNMSCAYCYSSALPEKSKMSWDVAKSAIDLIISNAVEDKKDVSIRYLGGGEPTIQWSLLKKSTEYAIGKAKDNGIAIFIRLITNGTLISEEKAEWISRNIDYVTLSFEVLPELQLNRPLASGRSSHDVLMKTISLFDRFNIKYCFRATISAESSGKMGQIISYAANNTNVDFIRLEPLVEIGYGKESSETTPNVKSFVSEFYKAKALGEVNGITVSCKMLSHVDFNQARICGVEFTVSPEGLVTACHRYSKPDKDGFSIFSYGFYSEGKYSFDLAKINKIMEFNVDAYEDCRDCFAKWGCAGSCLATRVEGNSVIEHGTTCLITREMLKESIVERLSIN